VSDGFALGAAWLVFLAMLVVLAATLLRRR
jgi:hypothetical protein